MLSTLASLWLPFESARVAVTVKPLPVSLKFEESMRTVAVSTSEALST